MTTEELLKTRYEVIAKYPGCPFNVGDILSLVHGNTNGFYSVKNWEYPMPLIALAVLEKYPLNFRELQWWEERKPEEMPIYLKSISDSLQMVIGGIYKVKNYHKDIRKYGVFIEGKSFSRLIETLMPATEAEYLEYKKHHQPPL